jgi:hypothetical protein
MGNRTPITFQFDALIATAVTAVFEEFVCFLHTGCFVLEIYPDLFKFNHSFTSLS